MNAACRSRRSVLLGLAAGAALLAAPRVRAADPASSLENIRARGRLRVGLYQDMPPFHVAGRGIDVAIGRAIAQAMQLQFEPLPFIAGESVDDDLRNMVWKGHYLGWGPSDVLLHVPLDAPLVRANPQVRFLAPYYRERVRLAIDRRVFTQGVATLADLQGHRVAVQGLSLAGWLLIGADHGALRETLSTHWRDGVSAAGALQAGEVAAAAGLASELESVLQGDERYAIQSLPAPGAPRDGWAVGCAVRKNAADLAVALQSAMNSLHDSGRLKSIFGESGVSWQV